MRFLRYLTRPNFSITESALLSATTVAVLDSEWLIAAAWFFGGLIVHVIVAAWANGAR